MENTPITDIVLSFEAACAVTPPSADVMAILAIKSEDPEVIAAQKTLELRHSIKVVNEGWQADHTDGNQPKYFPVFYNQDGVGLSYLVYDYTNTTSNVGSPLCLKNPALVKHMATHFLDHYKAILTFNQSTNEGN